MSETQDRTGGVDLPVAHDAPASARREPARAPRTPPLLVVPETAPGDRAIAMPITGSLIALRRESAVVADLGERFDALLDCLLRFQDETDATLGDLVDEVGDRSRARLLNQVKVLREISAWSRAVSDDLRIEARGACRGRRPVDTHALLVDAAALVAARFPAVRIDVQPDEVDRRCRVAPAEMTEAFYLALALTAERIGGVGAIRVDNSLADGCVMYRIEGYGEPQSVDRGPEIARFRDIIRAHGGAVAPGASGPAAAGMTLSLPVT